MKSVSMVGLRSRLCCGTAVVSIACALASVGSPAFGQTDIAPSGGTPEAGAGQAQEIVVTGTRIRGVAPVGSSIITLNSENVAKTGAVTTTDMLKKIPQISNAGASDSLVGGASVAFKSQQNTFQNGINIRGLGPSATLTLLNGQRLASSDSLGQQIDADTIPFLALSRIEVVPDGASAIYGADAIAGTANFILKDPVDVVASSGLYGTADGTQKWQVGQQIGRTWDDQNLGSGGIIISYQYSHSDGLKAADRPDVFNDNLVPYGGTPQTALANPGNITNVAATSTPVKTGTAPVAFVTAAPATPIGITLADLGTTNTVNRQSLWEGITVYPVTTRHSVVANFKQDLTDWVSFKANGFFSRYNFAGSNSGSVPSTTLSVPSTNPYSPCYAGKSTANIQGLTCPAGNLSVQYNFVNDLGAVSRQGEVNRWGGTGGLVFQLPYKWQATLSGSYSRERDYTENTSQINTTALNQVLSGTGKPSNVPYFDPFCDPRTYPSGSTNACNSPLTLAYISGLSGNFTISTLADYGLSAEGPLFELPGGEVRLATGFEFYRQRLSILNFNTTSAAGVGVRVITNIDGHAVTAARTDQAYYGELYVPIVGSPNAMTLVKKLELTAAVRAEDYSDFGRTTNPKFGINWTPVDGLKIHGSYGTSFHAPDLYRISPPLASGLAVNNTLTVGSFNGQAVGASATPVVVLTEIGGNANLHPEKATTWSIGADWTPDVLPGSHFSLTYYNIDFKDRIDTSVNNAGAAGAVTTGYFDQYLVMNPTYFPTRAVVTPTVLQYLPGLTLGAPLTQAQFNSFYAAAAVDPIHPFTGTPPVGAPGSIAYYMDARSYNEETIQTDGLDFDLGYQFDTSIGTWHADLTGTYALSFDFAPVPNAPIKDDVNTFGYPPRFRARLEAGWALEGWSATGFLNYTNAYQLWNSDDPSTKLVPFLPTGSPYQSVDSYTTFDLAIGYDTGERSSLSLLHNVEINVVVQNLFDQSPPLAINAGSNPADLYDPQNASALGRFLSVQVTKRW